MPRPKDAKVWNEDLVEALDARHQQAQREGKRDVHLWRTGRDKILAVRKDIYQFRTGLIVNLPPNLSKRVHRLCEEVIRGVKNIYPDGHIPTNNESGFFGATRSLGTPDAIGGRGSHQPGTPFSNTNNISSADNPFYNSHYMKGLKIRGGAFAVLMAFRYSVTEILTKRDICREAQKFCDTQMEANWHAGRTFGAWKMIDTLKSHNLVKEQGYATYSPNGFRDRPHSYSLTRDGELFLEALLAQRPEAAEAARQAAGSDPRTPTKMGTSGILHRAENFPTGSTLATSDSKSSNIHDDKVELEEWIATAVVGDRKDFRVGKDRRKKLHDLCDAMQRRQPGLLLTHGSSGASRSRTLTIQLVSKPLSMHPMTSSNGRKQPCSPACFNSVERLGATHSPSSLNPGLTAREMAGLAAARRQEQAKEEIELKMAILDSEKIAGAPRSSKKIIMRGTKRKRQQHSRNEGDYGGNEDKELRAALQASLQETKKPLAIKRNLFPIDGGSDDELPPPFFSTSPTQKKRKTHPLTEDKKSVAKNPSEIYCINSDSDRDDEELPQRVVTGAYGRKINGATQRMMKPRGVMSEELLKVETPGSINLCESSDNEYDDDIIEIRESVEKPINPSKSQLLQYPDFFRESLEDSIYLSDSQLSQDPNCIDNDKGGDGSVDNDEVIILEDATKEFEPKSALAKISTLKGRCLEKNNDDLLLTVLIDNRERDRNATPRTLRIELTRHLATGPLSNVWPTTLPPARVEEAGLEWGDIQYSVQSVNNSDQAKKRLGVSIERKRVIDLVQRSSDGDHLVQLFRMRRHCSLSVLLIENDTRTAQNVTPYNSVNKEGFDPLDSTVRCEDDIYRMFGRILLSCDSIKFMQAGDEQASLRSVGALGLMAVFAPSKCTKELEEEQITNSTSKGPQVLSDQLKQAGIPWRMAKRVTGVVGGPIELRALYDSCCNETAKSQLLAHIIDNGKEDDQGDLNSSTTGWSDAIYHIVAASSQAALGSEAKLSGEAALLLHKEFVEDHGFYLSTLYQGHSPEETLEKVLDNPCSSSSKCTELTSRYVSISLTSDQATKYFSPTRPDDRTFYKLSILSDGQSRSQSGAITMRTESCSLASKTLSVFELEGTDIVDLVRGSWSTEKRNNYVLMAKTVAHLVDNISHYQGRGRSSATKRILMVCGLQPALDVNVKKSGYLTEIRTVVDMVFAELLLCYDVTVLQVLRKNSGDRVNLVKQLALACYHCAFLVQKL